MAAFNVSLDDSSPLITYSPAGAWIDTPSNDTSVKSYQAQSMHTTFQQGASATFKFNGTGVWLFGGMRSDYGSLSLQIDGKEVNSRSAQANLPTFQQVLASAMNLTMGEHTAVLTATTGGPIDLDSVTFETQIGSYPGSVSQATIEDTSKDITYTPSSDWAVSNNQFFSNGSVHFAKKNNAEATFSFTGDALALYGGSSFDHGDYEVKIDGVSHLFNGGSNGGSRVYHPQTLLFFATNLGLNTHNITISSRGGDKTPFLDIDSVTVFKNSNGTSGDGSGGITFKINQASASGAQGSSTGLSGGGIAGIIIAVVLSVVALLAFIVWIVARRRQKKLKKKLQKNGGFSNSPVLPLQNPSDLEAGYYEEKKMPLPEPIPVPVARERIPSSVQRFQLQDGPRTPRQSGPGLPRHPTDVYLTDGQQRANLDRSQTTNTRWSQGSLASTDTTLTDYYRSDFHKQQETLTAVPPPPPPMPPMPSTAPLNVRGGRPRDTTFTQATDDFADYYRESTMVMPEPQPELPRTPLPGTPRRPNRPPELVLELGGTKFDNIPL